MEQQEQYMRRCLELAERGAGYVAPNPIVGAVLVYGDKIIGEGWHAKYGGPHAEVNCFQDALKKGFADQIASAVLYVSLEPCSHFGKTPPCADLIIHYKVPGVVIGCRDSFASVNGKGIEKLEAAGVNVTVGVLEKECRQLNKRFFIFHEQQRPYIILKWAETNDGFIAGEATAERLLISGDYANRLVHQWRSEEAAILVGTNTALKDNPRLTNRLSAGPSPVRVVVDMQLRLPPSLHLFDGTQRTIVLNGIKGSEGANLVYHKLDAEGDILPRILRALKECQLQSVLVEGGAQLLQSFIDAGLWDEIRIIKSKIVNAGSGKKAPVFNKERMVNTMEIDSDTVSIILNN